MTASANNNPPTIESLAKNQHRIIDVVEALSDGVATLTGVVTTISDGQKQLNAKLVGTNKKLDSTNKKLDGLMDDIGLVKGGHARNETIRNASLIAHRLGYQLISELRQEALIGFGELAKADGVPGNDAESFAKADLVMIAQDANKQPGYIAVEVSFTINGNDVRRAVRNADYLRKYTGIQAHPAVAGVDILPDAKRQVDAGKVHWYEIPIRDIQPA